MKVLIDTNIVLDVLCNRKEFINDSLVIFKLCEVAKIEGYLSSLSIPNIVYIMRKEMDNEKIKSVLNTLSSIFKIIDLRESDLFKAVEMCFEDYEDAIQAACAKRINADYIVTRNTKDYSQSPIVAIEPNLIPEILRKQ